MYIVQLVFLDPKSERRYFGAESFLVGSKAIPGQDWPVMALPGEEWPVLAILGEDWSVLAIPGEDWSVLAIPGEDWPVLAIPGEDWPVLALYGEWVLQGVYCMLTWSPSQLLLHNLLDAVA